MNDDDFNLEEEVAALFELWDDQDFAVKVGPEVGPNAGHAYEPDSWSWSSSW